MREILHHPSTRKHTIQCHHPIRKHTIQYHNPIRKVVMIIHYKYKATPSVKGTPILSNLSILSFLSERIRLRYRSGHGRSPRRPFFLLVLLAGECHIQSLSISSSSTPTLGPMTHGLQTSPVSAQNRLSNPNMLQPNSG